MKKPVLILLAALLLLSLGACGEKEEIIEAEPSVAAVYYHGDENAEKLIEEETQLPESYVPQDILDLLYMKNVIDKKVTVNKWSVNSEGHMELDLSSEFADIIQSQGTAGEYIIMGSLVNSLIKNFNLEEVYISLEGDMLASGHEIYDYPLSFFEN